MWEYNVWIWWWVYKVCCKILERWIEKVKHWLIVHLTTGSDELSACDMLKTHTLEKFYWKQYRNKRGRGRKEGFCMLDILFSSVAVFIFEFKKLYLCGCVWKYIWHAFRQASWSCLLLRPYFYLELLSICIVKEASAPVVYSFTFINLNLVPCLGAEDDRSGHLVQQLAEAVPKMLIWFYVGYILFVCLITIHVYGKEIQKNMTFQLPHIICVQTTKYQKYWL